MLGWLAASATGDYVGELLAADDKTAFAILCAWVQQRTSGDVVNLDLAPLPSGLVQTLYRCADGAAKLHASGNWQMFDWPAMVEALLQLKLHAGEPLPAGRVTVEIEDYGKICLEVDGIAARCTKTRKAADVSGPAPDIMRLLFGPLPPSAVMSLPATALPLSAWCPLPLYLPRQDTV